MITIRAIQHHRSPILSSSVVILRIAGNRSKVCCQGLLGRNELNALLFNLESFIIYLLVFRYYLIGQLNVSVFKRLTERMRALTHHASHYHNFILYFSQLLMISSPHFHICAPSQNYPNRPVI